VPEIARFFGVVIQMYKRDHPPPHLHAIYAEFIGVFDIQTGDLTDGDLPSKQKRLVETWIKLHKAELLDNWGLLQNEELPRKVAPLDGG
jgi:hypothetical protein